MDFLAFWMFTPSLVPCAVLSNNYIQTLLSVVIARPFGAALHGMLHPGGVHKAGLVH